MASIYPFSPNSFHDFLLYFTKEVKVKVCRVILGLPLFLPVHISAYQSFCLCIRPLLHLPPPLFYLPVCLLATAAVRGYI